MIQRKVDYCVDLEQLHEMYPDSIYDPETFPVVRLRVGDRRYQVFCTGKVFIYDCQSDSEQLDPLFCKKMEECRKEY